jgi:hypothetical protein
MEQIRAAVSPDFVLEVPHSNIGIYDSYHD